MKDKSRLKVAGLLIGQRRDGKNFYDEAAKRRLIAMCEQGVESVAAIALANGINPNVVHRWLGIERTRGRKAVQGSVPVMLPVVITDEAPPVDTSIEPMPGPSTNVAESVPIEIAFERGTLRFTGCVDESLVRMVAAALGPRC